jgi:hypothetical protein
LPYEIGRNSVSVWILTRGEAKKLLDSQSPVVYGLNRYVLREQALKIRIGTSISPEQIYFFLLGMPIVRKAHTGRVKSQPALYVSKE